MNYFVTIFQFFHINHHKSLAITQMLNSHIFLITGTARSRKFNNRSFSKILPMVELENLSAESENLNVEDLVPESEKRSCMSSVSERGFACPVKEVPSVSQLGLVTSMISCNCVKFQIHNYCKVENH